MNLKYKFTISLFIIFLSCFLSEGLTQLSIPQYPFGFHYFKESSAHVTIDMFIDLQCPYSANAWTIMEKVAKYYGNKDLQVIIHVLPLPYHFNGFITAMALHGIEVNYPDKYLDTLTYVFKNQASYYNSVTDSMTRDAVNSTIIAPIFSKGSGVSESEILEYLNSDSIGEGVVQGWKYGTHIGMNGTPLYLINGITPPSYPSTYNDWTHILDPLIYG